MQLNRRLIAALLIPAFLSQTLALPALANMESLSAPMPADLAEFTADLRQFCLEQVKLHPDNDQVLVETEIGGQTVMIDCTEAVKSISLPVESSDGTKTQDCVDCALKGAKAKTGAEPLADLARQAVTAAAKSEPASPPQPQLSCPADPDKAAMESMHACMAGSTAVDTAEQTLPPEASATARFKHALGSFFGPSTKADACREAAGVSGSAAGDSAKCAWKAISEILVGIFSAIPGIKDLIFGAAKFIAVGAERLAKGAFNLVKSLFTTNSGMEDKVADKAHLASQTPPDFVDQFYDDPAGTISNLAQGMYHLMTNYLDLKAKSVGCTKWSGVPDESECLAGTGGYACMTAKQKNDVLCAGAGAFIGNFLLGSVGIGAIAGLGSAVLGAAKGAAVAAKTSALLKGAMASSKGQAVSKAAAAALSATMKVARSKPVVTAFKAARTALKPIAVGVKTSAFAAKWTGNKIKGIYEALKKIPVAGDALSASAYLLKTVFVTADNYGMAFGKGGLKAVRAYRAEQAVALAAKLRREASTAQDALKAVTLAEARLPMLQEELAKLPSDAASAPRRAQLQTEIKQQETVLATRPSLQQKSDKASKVALDAENAVLKPLAKALEKNEGIKTRVAQGDDGSRVLEVVGAPDGSPFDAMLTSTRKVTQRGNPVLGESIPNGRVLIRSSTKAESGTPAIAMTAAGDYVVDPVKAMSMNAQQWMDAVSESKIATDMKRAGYGNAPEVTRAVVGAEAVQAARQELTSLDSIAGVTPTTSRFGRPARAELDRALATSNEQFVQVATTTARAVGNTVETLPGAAGIRFLPDSTTGAGKLAKSVGEGTDPMEVVFRGDNAAGSTFVDDKYVVVGMEDFLRQKKLDDAAEAVGVACRR